MKLMAWQADMVSSDEFDSPVRKDRFVLNIEPACADTQTGIEQGTAAVGT